ncbi:hypothetical protein GCM10027343_30180 [Noviherbaspirillum agri]
MAAPATTSTQPGYLILSEVASNYYSNDIAWFEVYNPGDTAVSLSRYGLRSAAIDPATGATNFSPTMFSLPAVDVPARGYLVVAGKISDKLKDNRQMVYVKSGAKVPYWNANGFIELTANGATADFVRFGNSAVGPITSSAWNGVAAVALPSGADQHGKSIVRLASGALADTNTASDWSPVNFSTPAGANDVPPGVIDSDQDGIPDSAKVSGGTYGGLDLYAMGARSGRRDIFVELDYMASADPGTTPRIEALQKMESTFAAKGIALHFDTGSLHAETFDPANFNLGGGNAVPFTPCIDLDSVSTTAKEGCASFMQYKSEHFDVRRKLVFHYGLFGNSLNVDGSAGSSGIAELYGNDLIITLGGYGFSTASGSSLNMLVNLQSSTLMHELGHNLGLRHGGNENTNYKPNHTSVMNYMYQFTGLSATPDSPYAAERYYLANGLKGKTYCNLVENSPCTANFIIGYSDGTSAALDENSLREWQNIGRGAVGGAYADWDNNNALTAGAFARNINPQDGTAKGVLRDYNEWANLTITFSRNFSGSNTGSALTKHAQSMQNDSVQNDSIKERVQERVRERIVEDALPADLHQAIRNMHHHHQYHAH